MKKKNIVSPLLIKLAREQCSKQQRNLVMKECRYIAEQIIQTPQNIGTFYITKGKNKQRFYQQTDIPAGAKYRTIRFEKDKDKRKLLALMSKKLEILVNKKYNNVHGFLTNRSIETNAATHLKEMNKSSDINKFLALDLENFFEQITFKDVYKMCVKIFEWNKELSRKFAFQMCIDGHLYQGNPLSPVITNILSNVLDERLAKLCNKCNIVYTRYADDLTFASSKKFTNSIKSLIIDIIRDCGFNVNPEKTVSNNYKKPQNITGYIINIKTKEVRASKLRKYKKLIEMNLNIVSNQWGIKLQNVEGKNKLQKLGRRLAKLRKEISLVDSHELAVATGWYIWCMSSKHIERYKIHLKRQQIISNLDKLCQTDTDEYNHGSYSYNKKVKASNKRETYLKSSNSKKLVGENRKALKAPSAKARHRNFLIFKKQLLRSGIEEAAACEIAAIAQ